MDAADEAIYKIGRRQASRLPGSDDDDDDLLTPTASSRMSSMDLPKSPVPSSESGKDKDVPESFYDCFRWLDEDDSLDLRLFLNDYHHHSNVADIREEIPAPPGQRRPSFRRHLSISKIPFSRSSLTASRPATKDNMTSPTMFSNQSPVSPGASSLNHGRRRSRALSLISPKHAQKDSNGSIDPAAAHYQDPEARLKLRVYLASPQKFDEAVEFGFPSADALSPPPPMIADGSQTASGRQPGQKLSDEPSTNLRTFLADDDDDDDSDSDRDDNDNRNNSNGNNYGNGNGNGRGHGGGDDNDDRLSVHSDQLSLGDPESPKTPQNFEKPPGRPLRASTDPLYSHMSKNSESGTYAQAPVSSREMTLRMTLTRPDLRAHEEQIYGWQNGGGTTQLGKRTHTMHLREDSTTNVTFLGDGTPKESIERVFAGIDHWNAQENDGSVMKRIWNRVRRS